MPQSYPKGVIALMHFPFYSYSNPRYPYNKLSNLTATSMDIETEDAIQVVVRIKPNQNGSFLSYSESNILLGKHNFAFDHVFLPIATQSDVYKSTGLKQIEHTLEGYNSCLFVYGQTGSGKTHTMIGNSNGIIQQSLHHLFNRVQQNLSHEYKVICSYFEIYNQQLFDLLDLNKDKKLAIRQDTRRGVFIEGLTEEQIQTADRGISLLNQGVRTRHVGETLMNRESSRSHAIFSLSVQSKQIENGISIMKRSKIHFVDLAGSQRQKSTAAIGQRLKEAGNINKSLTTLGMVINCLSSDKSKPHIPFRDSKLTFVLRDSLSGNSKTFLIATVADSESSIQQTLSTLKFAQRAKLVKLNASINAQSLSLNVDVLKSEIQRLREELTRVNRELHEQRQKKKSAAPDNEVIVNSYQKSMDELNQKINSLVDMIPKLLDKSSEPDESSLQQYIKNNNEMLSHINESLNKFVSLKNEVRAKASLQKLRMEDLTPYKFSVGRLSINKDANSEKGQSEELKRLEAQKRESEERVIILLNQQREIKESMEKILQLKGEQYSELQKKCEAVENRAFQLEEGNSNLLVEIEILKEKLRRSEERINSEGRVISQIERKLTSSGIYIQSLSKQMSQLHDSLSSSNKKHKYAMEEIKCSIAEKERELEEQERRYQADSAHWRELNTKLREEKGQIEEQSVRIMGRLQQELQRNDEAEAMNIELQKQNQQKTERIKEVFLELQQKEKRWHSLESEYEGRFKRLQQQNAQREHYIEQLTQQLSIVNSRTLSLQDQKQNLSRQIYEKEQSNLTGQKEIHELRLKLSQQVSSRQALKQQLFESKFKHTAELQQLNNTYSLHLQELSQSVKLKERCNQLIVQNYKLKNSSRGVQQPDNTEISTKLDYYEEKFNLMKIEYNKSIETIRVLKQREILIKEQNMKLNNSIKELELELQIVPQSSSDFNSRKKDKRAQKDNKQNERKYKSLNNNSNISQISELLRGMIAKLDGQALRAQTGKDHTPEQLLNILEDAIKKKQSKLKKQIQKETKIKSQNHLVLKQNLYLKEKIKNLEEGAPTMLTPSKRVKIN